jgi:hypothetical protein
VARQLAEFADPRTNYRAHHFFLTIEYGKKISEKPRQFASACDAALAPIPISLGQIFKIRYLLFLTGISASRIVV